MKKVTLFFTLLPLIATPLLAQTSENNVSTIEDLGGVIAISPTDTNNSKTKRIKLKSKKEKASKKSYHHPSKTKNNIASTQTSSINDLSKSVAITPNRVSQTLRDSTSNVSVITQREIKNRGYQSLPEALSRVSGFTISSNGGAGQTKGLFLRGFNSGNILILLDGVPLKDPTDPSFSAGLSHIRLDDVERIEVVKGAQSGIWGADASAGVVNIITKKAKLGSLVSAKVGYGSYDTKNANINLSSAGSVGSFSLSAEHFQTDGFSAYLPRGAEKDGYKNNTLHLKGALNIGDNGSIGIFYHNIDGVFDYDSGSPINPNDALSNGDFNDKLWGLRYDYDNGVYTISSSLSINQIQRDLNDSSWGASDYNGDAKRATLNGSFKIDDNQKLSGGIDYNRYEGNTTYQATSSYNNRGVFGSYEYITPNLFGARTIFNATLRYDDFNIFKNKTTYRFGIKRECHLIPGLFSLANIYSSYRAPSLYQYSTNTNLKPESTEGFEVSLGYKDLLKATYFRNRVKDRIDYNFSTWSYFNSSSSYTLDGIELESRYNFKSINLEIGANYTHMFSLTDNNNNPILRVPKNEGNIFIDYYLKSNIYLGANLQYVGDRVDYGNIDLKDYTVVNLSFNHKINSKLSYSIQAHNIFDEDYQSVAGYSTKGRSVYGSVEYKF